MFGAAAMSVSSFLVVMNALRLNLYNPENKRKNANACSQNCAINANKAENNSLNKEKIKTECIHENVEITNKETENNMKNVTIKIEGMMCPHCSGRVKTALEASELVNAADVSHERGDAVVTLSDKADEGAVAVLKKIINDAGYTTP